MTELLPGVETPSDAELISRVRGGDVAAYGELFSRHVEAARRLARQLMRGPDVDDLVSDAFAKTLNVIQAGGGPDVAFRAYLLTSVRRLHVDRIRAAKKVQPSDDMTVYDDGLPFQDTAVASFENGAAARAFSSLPERWQLVLWHLEVEGQKPAEIAPLLGMSPNSVSALAYRAREGLRQAFLTMHLADCATEQCRWVNQHLGAYVRKGLSRRDTAKVQQHLDECRRCTAMYLELTEVNSDLAAIIAPLLLGAAAAGYLTSAGGASLTGVAAVIGRIRDAVGAQGGGGAAGAGGSGASAGTATGGAVAAGGAVTSGGAIAAGGVIAAGVVAVTTAAVLFGGTAQDQITEAEKPARVVQTPASGGQAERGTRVGSGQQELAGDEQTGDDAGLASRSTSEVVVMADRPKQGAGDPGARSQARPEPGGHPANPNSQLPPAAVRPAVDLPGPVPGVPVPPVSVPDPPAPGGKPPSGDPAPPEPGAGDPDPDGDPAPPGSGGEPPKDQDKPGKDGSNRDDHAGGDTEHGNDDAPGKPGGKSDDKPGKSDGELSTSSVLGQVAPEDEVATGEPAEGLARTESDPGDQEWVSPQEPVESSPAESAPAEEPEAATPLTIHDVRMSPTTLEFELTASDELPEDVTVSLADGTHGVAFVPEHQPQRRLWEAGGTLRVTIQVVISEPLSQARLLFTVDAGDRFRFVDASGQPLDGPIEPAYEVETTGAHQPTDDTEQPTDPASTEPRTASVAVAGTDAVVVDRDGSGQVLVSVEGLDGDALVADPGRFRLVMADDPSLPTPFARVTEVVAGPEPDNLLVSFRIPPGHLDGLPRWLLRIDEDGPATEPFQVTMPHHHG